MTEIALITDEIDQDQKNRNNVRCQFCNSLILTKKTANYILKEVQIIKCDVKKEFL